MSSCKEQAELPEHSTKKSFFEEQAARLEQSTGCEQPEFKTTPGRADGEGVLFEVLAAGLVFLRCVRRRLTFLLSSNDTAGGAKFDDLILTWQDEDKGQKEGATGFKVPSRSEMGDKDSRRLCAVFVQLKYRTSSERINIRNCDLINEKGDFGIRNFYACYVKIRESLTGGNYALVAYTNCNLLKRVEDMFNPLVSESFPWMKLLQSGGCVYKLNEHNEDVKLALENKEQGDDQSIQNFIENFYLFCGQSSNEAMKDKICTEIRNILAADHTCSKTMCEELCSSITEWMKKHKFYLRSDWKSWWNIVDTYIKQEVTTCNSIVTRIKYRNVEALQAYIEGHNPAWIRPPGGEAMALTATKVHQIIRDEKHIVVSVTRLSELKEKVLRCWGPFCRWLVIVDDTEKSCDIPHDIMKLGPECRLIIVSHKKDYSFLDTFKSDDICDDTWKELTNVKIKLNSEQYSCRLGDLCDTEALKAMLDENPEALAALSQLTGPVRLGQDLDPLPQNHICREVTSRMGVSLEFFSSLGDKELCIMDEVSYNHMTKVSVNNTFKFDEFEELENYLCASNSLWPLFGVTENIDLSVIQMICSKYKNICFYVLSYKDDGWEILFLHRGSAKIRSYIKEQSRSLWQIVDGLSSRIIVDGKPGIGKSTFLIDIASQLKNKNPSWWILRINLLTYSEVFNTYSSSVEAVKVILHRVVYNEKNVGILEHSLLQHCLKEYAHIICLVDGFDEVCPDYADKCLQALQQLAPRRGKLVVTTRPSVTGHLEAAMGVLAHSLPAFSEEEVHRFHKGCKSNLCVTDVVVELLKIPLFSKMYAEALESGIVVDDIVSLYENFFVRKFRRLYEEKWCEDLSRPGKPTMFERERKKQENHLGFLAVSHLLPKLEVPSAAQTSSIDRDELVRAGVIYQFIDNKAIFIHRTFAEHFLAKWCFSDVAKGHCTKVYQTALSDNSLEFFVESFDRMASRDRPLLTAVLNGSESEVESLLQEGADPAETDVMGRNSLHLAAAYSRDSTLLWLFVERLELAGAERVGGSASGPTEETWEVADEVMLYEMGEKTRLADKERTSQSVQVISDLGLAEASGATELWAVDKTVVAMDPVTATLGAEDALLQWTPLRYAAERRRWRAVGALLEAGAQLRHLGDFQRDLHRPQELWSVFKENGYMALFDHLRGKNDWWSSEIKVGLSVVCAEMSPEQYKEISSQAVLCNRHWEVARLLGLKIGEMQNKYTRTASTELELNQCTTVKPRHEAALGGATPRDADIWTELYHAVAAGDAERLRKVIEAGDGIDNHNSKGRTVIHLAVLAGNVDCIKLLLSAGAAVNMKDETGATPLHRAVDLGRRQCVRLLLAAGADALVENCKGETPLHVAAGSRKAECVGLMVRAVKNLEQRDARGYTALHVAARSGDVASVKHLLAAGADSNAVSDYLETPLHKAADEGHTKCVRLLLQAKSDVAAKDKRGATALHAAVWSRNPNCVRCLLEAGAGIHEKDDYGDTPLHWAAGYGRPACIAVLLEKGADVQQRNRQGQTPLLWAAKEGKADCVKLLLDAGADVLARDRRDDTALHLAAYRRKPECVRLLIQAVKNPELKGEHGSTALHYAAHTGDIASVKHLLAAGADSNAVNDHLETPLHEAAKEGHTECVKLLLEAGAHVLAQDARSKTPLQMAEDRVNEECLMMLNSAVCDRQRTTN